MTQWGPLAGQVTRDIAQLRFFDGGAVAHICRRPLINLTIYPTLSTFHLVHRSILTAFAVDTLTKLIQTAIELAVPVAKPPENAKTHRNSECQEVIRQVKQYQRRWQATHEEEHWIEYRKAINKRGQLFAKQKIPDQGS